MKKRILSILLAAIMVFSLLPGAALADGSQTLAPQEFSVAKAADGTFTVTPEGTLAKDEAWYYLAMAENASLMGITPANMLYVVGNNFDDYPIGSMESDAVMYLNLGYLSLMLELNDMSADMAAESGVYLGNTTAKTFTLPSDARYVFVSKTMPPIDFYGYMVPFSETLGIGDLSAATAEANVLRNGNTVTFAPNGGTFSGGGAENINVELVDYFFLPDEYDGELPTVTNDGKAFAGWRDENDLPPQSVELFDDTTYEYYSVPIFVGSQTLTAQWAGEYDVTFDAGDGTFAENSKSTYSVKSNASGELEDNIPAPTMNGMVFAGWYDARGNLWDADATVYQAMTLTAQWIAPNRTVSLTWKDGRGNVISGAGTSYTFDVTAYVTAMVNGDDDAAETACESLAAGFNTIFSTYLDYIAESDDPWFLNEYNCNTYDDVADRIVYDVANINTLLKNPSKAFSYTLKQGTVAPEQAVSTLLGETEVLESIDTPTFACSSPFQLNVFDASDLTEAQAKLIGMDAGIILSTGCSGTIFSGSGAGAYTDPWRNTTNVDPDLKSLLDKETEGLLDEYGDQVNYDLFDTASLSFKVKAQTTGTLLFRFTFASPEMDQPPQYNDIFALFARDVADGNTAPFTNLAVMPKTSQADLDVNITVTNMRNEIEDNGYDHDASSVQFVNNNWSRFTDLPYNGITNLYNAAFEVEEGHTYELKLSISDVSDSSVDSAVFIMANSFDIVPAQPSISSEYVNPKVEGHELAIKNEDTALTGVVIVQDASGNTLWTSDEVAPGASVKIEESDMEKIAENGYGLYYVYFKANNKLSPATQFNIGLKKVNTPIDFSQFNFATQTEIDESTDVAEAINLLQLNGGTAELTIDETTGDVTLTLDKIELDSTATPSLTLPDEITLDIEGDTLLKSTGTALKFAESEEESGEVELSGDGELTIEAEDVGVNANKNDLSVSTEMTIKAGTVGIQTEGELKVDGEMTIEAGNVGIASGNDVTLNAPVEIKAEVGIETTGDVTLAGPMTITASECGIDCENLIIEDGCTLTIDFGSGDAFGKNTKITIPEGYAVIGGTIDDNGAFTLDPDATQVIIGKFAEIPTAATGLVYNGLEQIGVAEAAGYTVTNGKATNAGSYTATAKLKDGYKWIDFSVEDKTIDWTIAKAPLTVTAKDATIYRGEAAADTGVEYTGFVNNETEAALSGTLAYTYQNYTTSSPVGTYDIILSGFSSDNYEIEFVKGTLTVELKVSAVTVQVEGGRGTATAKVRDNEVYEAAEDTEVVFAVVTEDGYEFDHWEVVVGGVTLNDDTLNPVTVIMPNEALTLKAHIVGVYSVSFDMNGHGKAPEALENLRLGSKITSPEAPTADGYTFGGWFKEAACTTEWDFDTDTLAGDMTLFAKWTEVPAPELEIKVEGIDKDAVKGLDQIYSIGADTIEVKLTVTRQDGTETDAPIIEAELSADQQAMYLDITIVQTTADGSFYVTEPGVTLTLTLDFGFTGVKLDSVKVLRVHSGSVDTLTTVPNADGEYIELLASAGKIILHSNKFSTYAVVYELEGTDPDPGPSGPILPTAYPVVGPATTENGRLTISKKEAYADEKVTLTAKPDEGYELDFITATDKNGNEITLTDLGNGKFSFKMPASKVTVAVGFKAIEAEEPADEPESKPCPKDETCPIAKFDDTEIDFWWHDGIHYCIENGLMKGVSETEFDPNGTTSRAMIVTILWRLEGEKVANYAMNFSDVAEGEWYTEAIRWAASEGIVLGYDDGTYQPNKAITREELAAILYRYAQMKGEGFVGASMFLMPFDDLMDISDWASESVRWCYMHHIILGRTETTFVPKATATRAEAATMMQRFCESLEK